MSRLTSTSARQGHAMAQRYPELSDTHIQFIAKQKIFFVGTVTAESRVNVSSKGGVMGSVKVMRSAAGSLS